MYLCHGVAIYMFINQSLRLQCGFLLFSPRPFATGQLEVEKITSCISLCIEVNKQLFVLRFCLVNSMKDSVVKFRLGFKANFNTSPGRAISSSALGYCYMQLEISNNNCVSYPCKHCLFYRKQEKLMGIDCSHFLSCYLRTASLS